MNNSHIVGNINFAVNFLSQLEGDNMALSVQPIFQDLLLHVVYKLYME